MRASLGLDISVALKPSVSLLLRLSQLAKVKRTYNLHVHVKDMK